MSITFEDRLRGLTPVQKGLVLNFIVGWYANRADDAEFELALSSALYAFVPNSQMPAVAR